ncbi:MAG: hypothetical protein QM650_10625 [Microlunatus sp.]
MPTDDERPIEPCPPWCVADHDEHLMSEDFLHEGALVTVPAVVRQRNRQDGRSGQRQSLAVTLDIVRYRYLGDVEEWVYIGSEGELGLDISVESARRLTEVLRRLDEEW